MKLVERERVDGTKVTIGRRMSSAGGTQRASRRYTAEFRDSDGRQLCETLGTSNKSQARRLALEIQQRLDNGTEKVPEATITVEELTDRYFDAVKAKDVAPKTEWKYRADLEKLKEYCREAGITLARRFSADDLFRFRRWLVGKEYAAKTVEAVLVLTKQVFKWAWRQSVLRDYRLASVSLPKAKAKPQPCFSTPQVESLIGAAEGEERTAFAMMGYAGLRIGEVEQLQWEDVRLKEGKPVMLHIRRGGSAGMTKDKDERFVPVHPRIAELLGTPKKSGLVFTAIRERTLLAKVKELCAACGFDKPEEFKLHSLRHHFASLCANHGVAHRKALAWLGHSSSDMLDLYYHLHDDDSQQAMLALAAGAESMSRPSEVVSGFEGNLRAIGQSRIEKLSQVREFQEFIDCLEKESERGGFSRAFGISNDGNVLVGDSQGWYRIGNGPLTNVAGSNRTCYGISGDGTVALGWLNNQAARYILGAGTFEVLGIPSGAVESAAYSSSSDGSVILVGSSVAGSRSYRWTQPTGFVELEDLPGGANATQPSHISDDGTLITGFGTSALGQEAVLWDESLNIHRVVDLLAANGVAIPCGWVLKVASDVAINCGVVTIVGHGINPNGNTEGWIASYMPGSTPIDNDPDDDAVANCDDNCPNVANTNQANSDGDSLGNACDNCPNVTNANQADGDSDGVGDVCDNCMTDSNANQADADLDGDGDLCDNCPTVSNANQADSDSDGRGNACDNCPSISNANQLDSDSDGVGNVCDNCPNAANTNQADSDGDGRGTVCDNCPTVSNANQADSDADGVGNVCDNCSTVANTNQADADLDGRGDVCDNCPSVSNSNQADSDSDGVGNFCDNCNLPNADQADCNGDMFGDVCNIADGTSCDANGNVVPDECECEDHGACTFDHFEAGSCVITPVIFGDVNGTGVMDVDDILCTLNAFSNRCDCPAADIHPCVSDGDIDVDDLLASLDAFTGLDLCDCGG